MNVLYLSRVDLLAGEGVVVGTHVDCCVDGRRIVVDGVAELRFCASLGQRFRLIRASRKGISVRHFSVTMLRR